MNESVLTNVEDVIKFVETNIEDEVCLDIQWSGKFAEKARPELRIYNYIPDNKKVLENTLKIIINNFDKIYNNILASMLPILIRWEFKNIKEQGAIIETIEELHNARYPDDFLNLLQINCNDIEDEYCYYSLIFRVDYARYGYGDGMELVCYKDRVIFWSDGNTAEYLFSFRYHKNEITYLDK